MSKYLKRSKMDTLIVRASEIEIFAAAQKLQTSIFVCAISGGKHYILLLKTSSTELSRCNVPYKYSKSI